MLKACESEINSFYVRYATKEGISISEAKKRVTNLDIAEYEKKAERYVKEKDFSDKANEEMALYNATMKINRLELLKANIGLELITGHEELEQFMNEVLQGRTMDELKRQAGILGKTVLNNANKAHAIVNASFHNATFSDRIWMYQDIMKADLSKLLQSGLIQGKNPRVLAAELRKKFNVGVSNTERLMRTELARVQTEAQKQSLERNGFEEYTFIANAGCCDICTAINGKHFKVKDLMPGENAPPMHPNCRCSIAPYEDSEEYEEWLDYLEKGGTTAEWKAKNKGLEKSENADIINSEKDILKSPIKSEDENYTKLIEQLERNDVEYRPVEKHESMPTLEKIIQVLGGADQTSGSCASVGLAYIGQKQGWNILDFRDGESRRIFSNSSNLKTLSQMKGIKTLKETGASSSTVGNRLLKLVEKGKEYYLCVGRHASIVRKTEDDVLQYLELQSKESGWKDFDGNPRYTLKSRFGCTQSSSASALYDYMIDLDESDFTTDEFKSLLGFINTASDAQKKGVGGYAK